MSLLEEGQAVRDTYEVERFLGEGAFAEVYRVRHRYLGRQALKLFKTAGLTASEVEDIPAVASPAPAAQLSVYCRRWKAKWKSLLGSTF